MIISQKKDLEENSIQEIRISPRILKEDLKKQGMQFSSLENKINHLSKKKLLLDNKYSDEFNVSINENNRSVDMVVINANRDASLRKTPLQIKKNSTQKERSKSKSGFKSRTIATALLCEKCDETFQPQEFLEHMQYCHKNREDVNTSSRRHITEGSSNYFSTIFQNNDVSNLNEKYFSVQNIPENNEEFQFSNNNNSFLKRNNEPPLKKQSSELNNVLEGLNKEKNDIIFQLKHVEEKLQKTQIDNQIISEEKENLQVNLRNLLLELQNIKAQMAYSSEEKEQAENLLKKEIKILIKKLIKTKGKLVTQKKTSKIDCTNSSLVNLSGFINFYNQNKDNSTFGDKTLDTHNNADSSFLNQSIHQIYSNSLFSLANNPTTNSRNNSKSTIASAQQNTKMVIKTPTGNKEIFYTPNKNELEERNIRINIDKNFEKGDPKNFQLFKAKMNESTTTKPSKKMNRYNN